MAILFALIVPSGRFRVDEVHKGLFEFNLSPGMEFLAFAHPLLGLITQKFVPLPPISFYRI